VKPVAPAKLASKFHEPEPSTGTTGFVGPKVNLVPEGVARDAEGVSWGLYAGTVIVVLGVWVGISGYSLYRASKAEARVQELNARLTQVNTLIAEYEKDKTVHVALQKQFSLVSDLLQNHAYWTPFLQKLEETTIPDVYYLGMTANRNGDVTLRSVAKSYTAAARQIRAFERSSSFVKSVQVNQVRQELQKGATLPVPVITFDVLMKLAPEVFAPPETADATGGPTAPTGASQQQGQAGQSQQQGQQLPPQLGGQAAGQPQVPGIVQPTPNL
jgi:Tfp pilus assembly protein PilN